MTVYCLILLIVSACMLTNINKSRTYRKLFIFISFGILTILSAIRAYTVGADTVTYCALYSDIANTEWGYFSESRFEIGFLYFCKILSYFSENPRLLIVVTSFIIIPIVGWFILKYSDDVVFSTFIYIAYNMYFIHLSGMRQSLAFAVSIIAFDYLVKNRRVYFTLFVIIASAFHSSAILLLGMLLCGKIKYNKNSLWLVIGIFIISFICYKDLFNGVTSLIGAYRTYADGIYGQGNYFGALFKFLLGFLLYLFCHFILPKRSVISIVTNLCMWNLVLATFSMLMTMKMKIMGRIAYYFSIYLVVLLPEAMHYLKGLNRQILKLSIVLIMWAFFLVVGYFRPEWHGVVPYDTLFNEL